MKERYDAKNLRRENPEGIFSFQWHITDSCDQRCRHCYIYSGGRGEEPTSMSSGRMRDVLKACDEFTASLDMSPVYYITGGDPLLHPDFMELTGIFREKGQPFGVMCNPFHLTEKMCTYLKECGCFSVQMSLDGTEKTHDWFRMPGSYKKTIGTIPVITASGMEAGIMMTVSKLNSDELPEVMDAVAEAGASGFSFARYVPAPGGDDMGIEPLEYRKLLDTYAKKRREYAFFGCRTKFTLKDHLFALYFYEEGKFLPPEYCHEPGSHMPAGCHLANSSLTILPDGMVMACRRMDSSRLGNIFTGNLSDMWQEAKKRYRKYENFKDCSRCRLSPWCRGCPAIADALDGNCFGRDPQCWHVVEE